MPRILSRLPRPTPRTLPHTEKATTSTEPRALRSKGTSLLFTVRTLPVGALWEMNLLASGHISENTFFYACVSWLWCWARQDTQSKHPMKAKHRDAVQHEAAVLPQAAHGAPKFTRTQS